MRPYPPDSKPLIGFVNGIPGFFLAAGHEGDGICLSPATGKLVSDLIVDGAKPTCPPPPALIPIGLICSLNFNS